MGHGDMKRVLGLWVGIAEETSCESWAALMRLIIVSTVQIQM